MTACVVIPTYEEAENLPALVAAVRAALDCTIGIVDDGSPDGTGEIADALAGPGLWVIHRERKQGLASAYVAGFRRALAGGAEYVLEMDADFSHDPADLPRLLDAARAGADVVLGCPLRDLTGGFKCFRADALRAIDLDAIAATGFAFQVEATYRAVCAGLRVEEVPIVFHERRAGHSKLSAGIAAEALWRIPALR